MGTPQEDTLVGGDGNDTSRRLRATDLVSGGAGDVDRSATDGGADDACGDSDGDGLRSVKDYNFQTYSGGSGTTRARTDGAGQDDRR